MPDPVTQYFLSRGVSAPSADNVNRVRSAYAANPDLLDRRAMGLPGGLDDNSAVLDAMLDKHVAESMPASPGVAMVGQPEAVPPPSRTAPAAKGKGEVGGTDTAKAGTPSRQGNYGPGPSPSRQANYGVDAATTGKSTSNPVLAGDTLYNSGAQVGPTGQSGITEWLLGLLGAGAGAYGLSKMAKGGQPATPTGPLPGSVPTVGEYGAPQTVPTQTDATDKPVKMAPEDLDPDALARRQRMEAEIRAENDAMQRQMEADALKKRRSSGAQDTVNAARRLFRK